MPRFRRTPRHEFQFANGDLPSARLEKWDIRWLSRAREISLWSKDPSSRVGAVAVDPVDRRSLAEGYNGFPRSMEDREEWLHDREEKYRRTIHAEVNMVCDAVLSGNSLRGAHAYVYGLHSCENCSLVMAQAGVRRVVQFVHVLPQRWVEKTLSARRLLWECGVDVLSIINRVEGMTEQEVLEIFE